MQTGNRSTFLAGTILALMANATPAQATEPAAASGAVDSGLPATEHLLFLMDTDKSGKVSKQEFMQYMEQEFDRLDGNHDGVLDLAELKKLVGSLRHPAKGPGR
jgi:hypothetical protein